MDIYIGFDSAWTDNPKAPGAICAVGIENGRLARFHAPQLVSFGQALTFIHKARSETGATLIALDQPGAIQSGAIRRCGVVICSGYCHWLQRHVAGRGLSSRRPSRR